MKKIIKAYDDILDIYDEDDEYYEDSEWELLDRKSVQDSDGFYTDYTMYRKMIDGAYVYICMSKTEKCRFSSVKTVKLPSRAVANLYGQDRAFICHPVRPFWGRIFAFLAPDRKSVV